MTPRRVRRLAVPVVAEYSLQVGVLAVNTLLVSRAGDTALAAVGISNPIIYLFLAVFAAISVGTTVIVAQATGAGNRREVNAVARQAITWGLLLAIPRQVEVIGPGPAIQQGVEVSDIEIGVHGRMVAA